MTRLRFPRILALLVILILPAQGNAAWQTDGNPVSVEFDAQIGVAIVPDGFGGAVFSWSDNRSGNQDIYTQRANASGTMLWALNGLAVCTAAGLQTGVSLVRHGGGGAIIAWTDQRNGGNNNDVYVQKVAPVGGTVWTPNGVPVSMAAFDQGAPVIATDTQGGAIMAWIDRRSGTDLDVYAQRVRMDGTMAWTPNGVPVGVTPETQTDVRILEDGTGGAIVAWRDYRDVAGDGEILAQRLAGNGTALWEPNGLVVSNGARMLGSVTYAITTDGANGCFLAWHDTRVGALGIYCQRVLGTGVVAWPADVALTLLPFSQSSAPTIVPDGSAGVIVAWQDTRSGDSNIFAQRVNASGAVQWPANGVAVVDTSGTQAFFASTPDPAGAIVAFRDDRSGNPDVYAQLMDHAGKRRWGRQGRPVCTAPDFQSGIQAAPAQSGGAFITWVDYRSGDGEGDIYANATGLEVAGVDVGTPLERSITLLSNAPNPFGTHTMIRYFLSEPSGVRIEVFNPDGTRVWDLERPPMGSGYHSIPFAAERRDGTSLPAGVYPYRIRAGGETGRGRLLILR